MQQSDQSSQDRMPSRGRVVVIGAGIVGACTALALVRDGWDVTIVEAGTPGGRQAASYGNGAFLSPASVVPMSMPGLWCKVPGYLLDPLGPLTIRWRSLPRLSGWLWRFLWAGATEARVRRTAAVLGGLLRDAPDRHLALAADLGVPAMIRREGLIYAYPDRGAFAREGLAWSLRRDNGVVWHELEADELHAREPALGPAYRFAAFVPAGGHCTDPGRWVATLVDAACARGARLQHARVTGLCSSQGRLTGVETSTGHIACDAAVICAGVASVALAAQAGDRIPLVSERGYHVQLPGATGGPCLPVMPSEGKMANTPCAGGVRASGQVELATVEARPDWRRADILLENLKAAWPGLQGASVDRWLGHRPSTPDGLPVIGKASGLQGVCHAFGHGHVGLASGPITAELVCQILAGREPTLPLAPFAPRW